MVAPDHFLNLVAPDHFLNLVAPELGKLMSTTKLRRGQKRCVKCSEVNASRSRRCVGCNNEFISKNTPIKNEIIEWQLLEKGDEFKVVQGTGPYFICTRDSEEGESGERLYMGARGVFRVVSIHGMGISAYGIGKKNSGFDFIYMGEKSLSTVTGITKSAYRIVKMKKKKPR